MRVKNSIQFIFSFPSSVFYHRAVISSKKLIFVMEMLPSHSDYFLVSFVDDIEGNDCCSDPEASVTCSLGSNSRCGFFVFMVSQTFAC